MSRLDPPQGLLPSLLDRLIDPDSMGTGGRPGYGLQQLIDSVRSDLEDLLNTRQSLQGVPAEFTEVQRSLLAYGLPDLASINVTSAQQCAEVARVIEAIVARFEPRLRNIRVTTVRAGDEAGRTLHFHLEAALNVDPAPELGFETVLELTTGHASIKASEGGRT